MNNGRDEGGRDEGRRREEWGRVKREWGLRKGGMRNLKVEGGPAAMQNDASYRAKVG